MDYKKKPLNELLVLMEARSADWVGYDSELVDEVTRRVREESELWTERRVSIRGYLLGITVALAVVALGVWGAIGLSLYERKAEYKAAAVEQYVNERYVEFSPGPNSGYTFTILVPRGGFR